MNINTIKDIVIVALILFCINKFAPVDGVILGFSGLGFIVFILGFLKIYKKSQFEVRDDKKFKKIMLSALVACVSLIFWVPMFTLKHLFLFKEAHYGIIFLWMINTGVYTYLLLWKTNEKFMVASPLKQETNENS